MIPEECGNISSEIIVTECATLQRANLSRTILRCQIIQESIINKSNIFISPPSVRGVLKAGRLPFDITRCSIYVLAARQFQPLYRDADRTPFGKQVILKMLCCRYIG
eukprot:330381_1